VKPRSVWWPVILAAPADPRHQVGTGGPGLRATLTGLAALWDAGGARCPFGEGPGQITRDPNASADPPRAKTLHFCHCDDSRYAPRPVPVLCLAVEQLHVQGRPVGNNWQHTTAGCDHGTALDQAPHEQFDGIHRVRRLVITTEDTLPARDAASDPTDTSRSCRSPSSCARHATTAPGLASASRADV